MEIGEGIAIPGGGAGGGSGGGAGKGSAKGSGSGKDDGAEAKLVNPRWEHADDGRKRERGGSAQVGDEVWLQADAQQGFSDGDGVLFLVYDDDRRFAVASGKVEGGTARVKWVVRAREPGKAARLTFDASAKGACTDRTPVQLR